jgi:hypothetical protein
MVIKLTPEEHFHLGLLTKLSDDFGAGLPGGMLSNQKSNFG